MYLVAPRWRGTSPVVRLRSASRIRGLGLIDYTAVDPSGSTPCNQVAVPAGFVGPINCDASAGGTVSYPASQDQLAVLASSLQAPAAGSVTAWLNANAGTVALVGGGLVLLVFVSSALRR